MMFLLTAATVATAGIVGPATYFSPLIRRYEQVRALRKQLAERRALILTYDDGPSEITLELLDLLAHHTAKASFFMMGKNAQLNTDVADRVVHEGHDVGCHSDQHLDAWKVAPWRAVADVKAGYDRLSPWIRPDGMFRPPYGRMTLPTYRAVRGRGAPVIWWTIDAGDTHEILPSPNQVAEALRSQGGGIVLMHDINRSKERDHFVLTTTDLLLSVAQRESFKIMRLSELCL